MSLVPDGERWARLKRWEDEQLAGRPNDYLSAFTWLAAAREVARQLDPEWDSPARAEAHALELAEDRRRLARVRSPR